MPNGTLSVCRVQWEGYLWSPRCPEDLLGAIKEILFKVLINLQHIPERVQDNAAQLFIHLAIPPDRRISTTEAKGVLFNMEPDHLADAVIALRNLLKNARNRSPVLWRETIQPWFKSAWPKRPQDRSHRLSEQLAVMAIDAGDAFPMIVQDIADIVMPPKYQKALYHLKKVEEEDGIVGRHPAASLLLTGKLVGNAPKVGLVNILKPILDAIRDSDPGLAETEKFKQLALIVQ